MKRVLVPVVVVCLAGAMAVPGCGTTYDTPVETQSAVVSEPTPMASPEPTVEPPVPEPGPDLGWMHAFNDVAVTADGLVYASAPSGIAMLDGFGEWAIVDTAGLPEGKGPDDYLPGRLIDHVATGPDGQLWAAGCAHSTVDDEEFGGVVDEWFEMRALTWIARHDCGAGGCSWEVFTSDDTPELRGWPSDIGDIAIGPDGTFYASVGDNQLAVYGGSGWEAHSVPDLPTGWWDGGISPWSSSLAVGTDGLVWAGINDLSVTNRGLFTFDGADFTRLTTDDGLPSDNTVQVAAGGDGTIWVATDVLYDDPAKASPEEPAGIAGYDGTSWTTYTVADGLLSNDGIVAAGPDGTAWVVHNESVPRGYARFDGGDWTAFPADLPVGGFRAVVDSGGTLWTPAQAGLVRVDGTTKTVYPSPFATDEQAVFSFATDDLCEWVTEEEVAEFVAAEFDWEGTAVVDTRRSEEAACRWRLSGRDDGGVSVHDVGQWKDFDGNPYVIPTWEVVDYEGGPVDIGASVVGHPALSDGVVVHNGGFGQFAFGVPPHSEWLQLWLDVSIGEFEWDAEHEAAYFAVADRFVRALGWLDEE